MDEKNYTGAVPENTDGSIVNAESKKDLSTIEEARHLYQVARERLLDVNNWGKTGSAGEFALMDQAGNPLQQNAEEGLLIRIDVPGPGTKAADGFDWVRIEKVKNFESEDVQSLAIRVRPVAAPTSDEEAPAHFYSEKSTSTFTITREFQTVTAGIYDRDLEENVEAENLIDKVRNAVTGFFGKEIFSKIQWQSFAEGLIR
jgi:hypothetical protein